MTLKRVKLVVALLMLAVLTGELPARGAFPGANGRIAFSRYESSRTGVDLLSVESDGSASRTLWADCGDDSQIEWDPSGQKLVFMNAGFTHEGSFRTSMVVSDPTTGPRTLGPGYHPGWSPDGTRIAFSSGASLTVMNIDGSDRSEIWQETGSVIRAISWSPLGDRIAFSAGSVGAPGDVYSIRPDGSGLATLVASPDAEDDIDWSPDARFLVFTRRVGSGLADLFLADVTQQTGLTKLTDTPDIDERDPVFSPDGTRIAYTQSSGTGGPRSIVLIDGAGNRTDVPNTTGAFGLDWQPLPTLSPSPTLSASPSSPSTGGSSSPPAPGPPPCPSPSFAQCPTSLTTCPPRSMSPSGPSSPTASECATAPCDSGFVRLEASRSAVRYSDAFDLSGVLTGDRPECVVGRTVEIHRTVFGDLQSGRFDVATTSADGTFSKNYNADRSASYLARVIATADCAERTSSTVPVSVGVKVGLRSSELVAGRTTLLGRVVPCSDHRRTRVRLQRGSAGDFRTVARQTLNRRCRFAFIVSAAGPYRAQWPSQDDDHEPGISRTIRVRR